MADAFTTAATSPGLSKSEFARALIVQPLRNENLARALILSRPRRPFTTSQSNSSARIRAHDAHCREFNLTKVSRGNDLHPR